MLGKAARTVFTFIGFDGNNAMVRHRGQLHELWLPFHRPLTDAVFKLYRRRDYNCLQDLIGLEVLVLFDPEQRPVMTYHLQPCSLDGCFSTSPELLQ